jgi:thioredoxin-related protein
MKSSLLIISFFLLVKSAFSQDVLFFTGTWEEAQAKAKSEEKYLMVDAYAEWCGPCKRMDKEKFHGNPEVGAFINQNFVAYKVDCEKGQGPAIAMKFKVISYPTLLFFNPQGQLVSRSLGYNANPRLFLDPFKNALAIKEKKVFAYDSKQLDPGFPDVYKNAFKNEDAAVKKPTMEDVLQYLDQQKDKFSETSWAVMYIYSFPGKYNAVLHRQLQKIFFPL